MVFSVEERPLDEPREGIRQIGTSCEAFFQAIWAVRTASSRSSSKRAQSRFLIGYTVGVETRLPEWSDTHGDGLEDKLDNPAKR
jgi:hypothetical protein